MPNLQHAYPSQGNDIIAEITIENRNPVRRDIIRFALHIAWYLNLISPFQGLFPFLHILLEEYQPFGFYKIFYIIPIYKKPL
jgi:hypothetical protein